MLMINNNKLILQTLVEVPDLSVADSEYKLASCGSHLLVSNG